MPDQKTEQPTEPTAVSDPALAPVDGEFVRVLDKDTKHKLTIRASRLHLGNYQVLKQPAINELTGDPLPPEHHTPSGQTATQKKEND